MLRLVSVCYDVVLIEYDDGQWSIEPVGIPGIRPGNYLVSGTNPVDLIERVARDLVSNASGLALYAFNIRFLSPDGAVLATSTITSNPSGRHHRTDTTHEDVFYSEVLCRRLRTSA